MAEFKKIGHLQWNVPIVDRDGRPTPEFMRQLQLLLEAGGTAQGDVAGKADKITKIIAGHGLDGGGDLSQDRTLALDASLGDLDNVDDTGIVDGQTIVWDDAAQMYVPGNAGGGGSGERIWGVINSVTGAIIAGSGNFTYTRLSNDQGNVVFNTPLPDTNYGVLFGGTDQGLAFGSFPMVGNVPKTTTTFRVFIAYNTAAAGQSTAFAFEVLHESLGGGGGSGTVTSVDVESNVPGLTATGGPVTSAGTIDLDITDADALRDAIGAVSHARLWSAVSLGY